MDSLSLCFLSLVFEAVRKNFENSFYLVFEVRVGKNLGVSFCVVFEVVFKNLGDSVCMVFEVV